MSRDSIRDRIEELEEDTPAATERWIASLLSHLPEHEVSRVVVVEDIRDGQSVYKDPESVVSRGEGVVKTTDGANVPNPPEEFTHVASGPKGVDSHVVHRWELYADLERHEPPESVTVRELPVQQPVGFVPL